MTIEPFFYILDEDRNPLPADSVSWGEWFDHYDRVVGFVRQDDISVNTVFVGLDRNYRTNGPPLLFETLVLGRAGKVCSSTWSSTWAEAEAVHRATVKELLGAKKLLHKDD